MAIKLRTRDVQEICAALDYGLECLHADIENLDREEDARDGFDMRVMFKTWSELHETVARKLKKKGR